MGDLHIEDKYRKNPLSLKPGGYTVAVTFQNGKRYLYDKIKRPNVYIRNISQKSTANGSIVSISVEGNLVWDISQGGEPWNFHI
jgi:hypothetical protein